MAIGVSRIGKDAADTIYGGAGDDYLDGLGGDDRLYGRGGQDNMLGGLGRDQLFGGDGHDDLHGEAGDDQLRGEAGDDWLQGGEGADLVDGGSGTDWAVYETAAAGVTVNLGLTGPQDTGGAGLDTLVGIERVFGSAFADTLTAGDGPVLLRGWSGDDILRGSGGDDALVGDDGNDSLDDGGGGVDYLEGGRGDDSYRVSGSGQDTILERAGEGVDTVFADASWVLSDNVENLILLGSVIGDGTGNTLDNVIRGSRGDNTLFGLAGDDVLFGDFGRDRLEGGAGNDRLDGWFGDDTLLGGDGNDVLTGGGGIDRLAGGAGADVFVYTGVSDSHASTPERILDFDVRVDRIDLSGIDADTSTPGDQAFALTGFQGQPGQARLIYDPRNHVTTLELDLNGDWAADFALFINGQIPTAGGAFLVL